MKRRSPPSGAPTIAAALEPVKPVSQRTLTRSVTSRRSSSRSAKRAATRSARSGIFVELLLEAGQSRAVALNPLAAHRGDAQVADHRLAPPRLTVLDVGKVDLDGGQAGELQRVADRPGVVGPG